MQKKTALTGLVVPVLLWICALAADAQNTQPTDSLDPQQEEQQQEQEEQQDFEVSGETFTIRPSHFGLGTLAMWQRDAGEPGHDLNNDTLEDDSENENGASELNQQNDPNQFGLYLQKQTQTSNIAASSAEIIQPTSSSAGDLKTLAFDISGAPDQPFGVANGYCGTGSPRFDIESDAGTCALGCAQGVPTQDSTTGWWEIKFEAPFAQYSGCENDISGTIKSISIVFDEGSDLGPGSVVLDNIRVNDRVVGQPTATARLDNEDLNANSVNTGSVGGPGSPSQSPVSFSLPTAPAS